MQQPILGLDIAPPRLELVGWTCLGLPWPRLPASPCVRPLVGHFQLASQSTEREPQESACFIVRTNCCSTTVQHELDGIKMYTSQKREHVNAFASRLLLVDSETLLRDQECIASGTGRIAFRTTRRVEVAFR